MSSFFRDFVAAALILVAALVAVAAVRFYFADRLPSRQFGLRGLEAMPHIDLIFIGSSRTRQGYDPALLKKLGCEAYLLGYNGLSPAFMEPVVQSAARMLRGKSVLWVVEASSHAMLRPPVLQDTRLFLQLAPAGKRAMLRILSTSDPTFGFSAALSLLLRTDNEMLAAYPFVRPFLERASYRGGYTGKQMRALDAAAFARMRAPADLVVDAQPDPAQVQGLARTIQGLQAMNARAVFVEPPMPSPATESSATQLGKRWLENRVKASGSIYLDGGTLVDETVPANFSDTTHLSTEGRAQFTLALGRAMINTGLVQTCDERAAHHAEGGISP